MKRKRVERNDGGEESGNASESTNVPTSGRGHRTGSEPLLLSIVLTNYNDYPYELIVSQYSFMEDALQLERPKNAF